jgi:protein TonB
MMHSVTTPVATSFSLSVLLHAAAFAALLLVYEQVTTTGQGLEIELVSSTRVSQQQETDEPRKHETSPLLENISAVNVADKKQKELQQHHYARPVLTSRVSAVNVSESEHDDNERSFRREDIQAKAEMDMSKQQPISSEGRSGAQLMQATNAAQQQHSLLELLHDSISDNKEYPYIARRQHREGVATVSFVLHPDGSIENAHLVNSSRTKILDRAAMSAIKKIEPFKPAQVYLKSTEEFKVNVVFNLQ